MGTLGRTYRGFASPQVGGLGSQLPRGDLEGDDTVMDPSTRRPLHGGLDDAFDDGDDSAEPLPPDATAPDAHGDPRPSWTPDVAEDLDPELEQDVAGDPDPPPPDLADPRPGEDEDLPPA